MLMRAGTEGLRHQNRAIVLESLRKLSSTAHTDITKWSGLASGTVSVITSELHAEGAILKVEQPPRGGRGRPRVWFSLNPDFAFMAIIRITSGMIEFSLVDYAGRLQDRFEEDRHAVRLDVGEIISQIKSGLSRMQQRHGFARERLKIISITTKGLVASGGAVLKWSPVLEDQEIDFEQHLSPDWPAKITLVNETRFTAHAIAAKASRNGVPAPGLQHAVLSLSHSIGLGIVSRDATGRFRSQAPQFGHMIHIPDGALCRCGSRGCIEAYAGFYGILRTAFDVPNDVIPAKFIPLSALDKLADDARRGDRQARFAFRLGGEAIGVGLSRLFSLFGTMSITLTGGGVRHFDLMQEGFDAHLQANIQSRFAAPPVISMETDEAPLIFDGNVQASLTNLDDTMVATKNMTRKNTREQNRT